jgi:cation transport protein ChaC
MAVDTTRINRLMTKFQHHQQLWVFGYGSLIFKSDFPYLKRRPARIRGWVRRFWQGSHDHRGTPEAPGRVVTLIAEEGAVCEGVAYLVTPAELDHLDFREKNGYLRAVVDMTFPSGETAEGLVYLATADNEAFLGPAPEHDIARQIARATGPSGTNRDYLLKLAQALRELAEHDPHVFAIERHLLALEQEGR